MMPTDATACFTCVTSVGAKIDTLTVQALLQVSAIPPEILGLGLFAGLMTATMGGRFLLRSLRSRDCSD